MAPNTVGSVAGSGGLKLKNVIRIFLTYDYQTFDLKIVISFDLKIVLFHFHHINYYGIKELKSILLYR